MSRSTGRISGIGLDCGQTKNPARSLKGEKLMVRQTPIENPAEEIIWEGGPSQWTAFLYYLGWSIVILVIVAASLLLRQFTWAEGWWYYLLGLILVGLFMIVLRYLNLRVISYQLTNLRLVVTYGLLSRHTEEIELYRVRDWGLLKPFWLRLVGRGHVRLVTNDPTSPVLMLTGVAQPDHVREQIREYVERARDRKRVRQLDVDNADGDDVVF